MTINSFIKLSALAALLVRNGALALPQALGVNAAAKNGIKDWLSPRYDISNNIYKTSHTDGIRYTPFQAQLAIPPVAQPKATYTEPINGTVIDYFEIEIVQFQAQTVTIYRPIA